MITSYVCILLLYYYFNLVLGYYFTVKQKEMKEEILQVNLWKLRKWIEHQDIMVEGKWVVEVILLLIIAVQKKDRILAEVLWVDSF